MDAPNYAKFFFFNDSTTLVGPGVFLVEVPRSHCVRHRTFGRTPVDDGKAVTETST